MLESLDGRYDGATIKKQNCVLQQKLIRLKHNVNNLNKLTMFND